MELLSNPIWIFFFLSDDYGGDLAEMLRCLPNFQVLTIGEINSFLKFLAMEFWKVYDSWQQLFKVHLFCTSLLLNYVSIDISWLGGKNGNAKKKKKFSMLLFVQKWNVLSIFSMMFTYKRVCVKIIKMSQYWDNQYYWPEWCGQTIWHSIFMHRF